MIASRLPVALSGFCTLLAVLFMTGCGRSAVHPPGFEALGTTLPETAESITIPDGFTEQLPETPEPAPTWTAAETGRGFVVFARHYLESSHLRTVPVRSEITDQLTTFSGLGEYEPVTFSLHALTPLQDVQITISELHADTGGVIPASHVDVRSVRCWPKRVWKNPPVAQYRMAPWFLEQREKLDVPTGQSQRYWVTVWTAPEANPGLYRGTLRVSVRDRTEAKVHLQVRVLPITLRTPPTRHGMYYHMFDPMDKTSTEPLAPELQTRDIVNMREHGMNTAMVMLYPLNKGSMHDGKVSYDLEPIAHFVETGLAVGMDAGIWNTTLDALLPQYDGPGDLGENVRGFVDGFKNRHWPTPTISFGDESDAHDTWETSTQIGLIKKAVSEAKTFTTIVYPKNSELFEPDLDIRAFSSFLDGDGARRTVEAGRALWMYSGPGEWGMPANRYYRGLWAAALRLDGVLDWVYFHVINRDGLYNDLESQRGGPNHRGWVMPTPDGPLPTLTWEAMREGIDDGRYFFTLQSLIDEARASSSDEAKQYADTAQAYLDTLFAQVDTREYGERYPLHRTCDNMTASDFDTFRYQVAEHIMVIQAAMR